MIECSPEKILQKLFRIFNSEDTDEIIKFEIINYLKYYNSYKIETDYNYTSDCIIKFFCDYLKTKWNEDLEEEDISVNIIIT